MRIFIDGEWLRLDTVSSNPHNALADAMALRDWYVEASKTDIEMAK